MFVMNLLGYQYPAQYPPYYQMAPVYRWYQRDDKPSPEVEMEPRTKGENPRQGRRCGNSAC